MSGAPRITKVLVLALACAVPSAAQASQVTRHQAKRLTRHAAAHAARRRGLDYPARAWTASCHRARQRRWRWEAGTGGQCSAYLLVGGTHADPRVVGRVRLYCFE